MKSLREPMGAFNWAVFKPTSDAKLDFVNGGACSSPRLMQQTALCEWRWAVAIAGVYNTSSITIRSYIQSPSFVNRRLCSPRPL